MYKGVVCVQFSNHLRGLYEAPPWESLKEGDYVVVPDGEKIHQVIGYMNADDSELEFIAQMAGEKLPLKKVLAKVSFNEFKYPEEAEDETDQN